MILLEKVLLYHIELIFNLFVQRNKEKIVEVCPIAQIGCLY